LSYRNEKGVSFSELLVVISLLGVLSAFAIPFFNSFLPGYRLNGAARQILSDFMLMRSRAVKENNTYLVTFTPPTQYLLHDDDNGNGTVEVQEWSLARNLAQNYIGVTLTATTNLTFTSRGTTTAGTVTVTNAVEMRTIVTNITGFVEIQDE